jgi:hypothetical protein
MTSQMQFVNPNLRDQWGKETNKAYVPKAPNIGRAPGWLTKRIRQRMPEVRDERWGWHSGITLVHEAANLKMGGRFIGDWIDHAGSLKLSDGRTAFVSEPYGLFYDSIEALLAFCNKLDIECTIDAGSSHFPTRCLRITLTERLPRSRCPPRL